MARRHDNTWSRRAALQVLYIAEITERKPSDILAEGITVFEDEEQQAGNVPDAYAAQLLSLVEEHQEEIDQVIDSTSDNWAVSRMPIMDRSVLRLAVAEMRYVDGLSLSVSINEAVELAKDFGGEDESHRFVNGVLGKIAKQMEECDEDA